VLAFKIWLIQLRLAAVNRDWAKAREFLVQLSKRRGQAKKAVIDMV